jgi:acyl-ACP thioesterase
MQKIWEASFKVPNYDVDFNNRLKLSALFNYLQDAASAHATHLGVGFLPLRRAGLFWVLSWVRVEIDNYPRFSEELRLRTWPKQIYKRFSLRDFIISDTRNTVLGRARTAWLLVDAAEMRAVPIERLPAILCYTPDQSALEELPEKIPPKPVEQSAFQTSVRYGDIDVNQHVNNARYVAYILDAYDAEQHRDYQVQNITLSFLAESKYGEQLDIRVQQNEKLHYVVGENLTRGQTVFQALLGWTKR